MPYKTDGAENVVIHTKSSSEPETAVLKESGWLGDAS